MKSPVQMSVFSLHRERRVTPLYFPPSQDQPFSKDMLWESHQGSRVTLSISHSDCPGLHKPPSAPAQPAPTSREAMALKANKQKSPLTFPALERSLAEEAFNK